MNKILWHPLLPAIALSWWGFRLWTGAVTWTTLPGFVLAVVWLVLAIKIRRSGAAPESALSAMLTPRKPSEAGTSGKPPSPGTPEYDAYMRHRLLTRLSDIQGTSAVPPPPVPTEEQVRATARPAIFLRRATFPVPLHAPGRSYVGGLPRLPPELPWPEKEMYERFALTFLAQIDLAELPVTESSPLPRSGTLYFFSDPNGDGSEPADGRVLYYPGDTTNVPVRDLPKNARPYIDDACGDPWPWLAEESVWARTGFRFPLVFAKFDSYCNYFIEEGARRPPRLNKEALDTLMGDELERCFGPLHDPAPDKWEIFRQDREQWPFAWTAIEHGARAILHAARKAATQREAAAETSVYERIGSAASRWVARAATEAPHARPEEETRVAFRNEWRALVDEFGTTSKRLRIYSPDLARDLLDVVIASCYVCASHDALDVIPEEYRSALEKVNAASLFLPMHQMLGHAMAVQSAPVEHADHVLLLQLQGDDALGWHSNIGCALQFWISADALEQCAFDAVEMTLDCD